MAKASKDGKILRTVLGEGAEEFSVDVLICPRNKARNYKIWIEGENLVGLGYPSYAPLSGAMEFLRKNSDWIKTHLVNFEAPKSLVDAISQGRKIYVGTDEWKVSIMVSTISERFIEDSKGRELLISCKANSSNEPSVESVEKVFINYCRDYIKKAVEETAKKHGIEFTRIEVRNQSGRWASRSTNGTLSINWRMVFLSAELQNYLICHELAHARFMDHSVSFWLWLSRICPNARALDRRLSQTGKEIFKIGR